MAELAGRERAALLNQPSGDAYFSESEESDGELSADQSSSSETETE